MRIGTGDSPLAVVQGKLVMERVQELAPQAELELVTISKEAKNGAQRDPLEAALLDGRIEIAVHPLQEMPLEQDARLPLAAFFKREDPRDGLVLRKDLERFPLQGGVIGTESNRRMLQLKDFYPTAQMKTVSDDLQTLMEQLDRGEYDALVLSAADLRWQGMGNRISRYFNTDQLIPAVGQGILGIQCRMDADLPFIPQLGDTETTSCAIAERAFARTLQRDRSDPSTAYAEIHNGVLKMVGFCVDQKGKQRRGAIAGRPVRAAEMGARLAQQLVEEQQ